MTPALQIVDALQDISGAMPGIREIILSSIDRNFREQGRPNRWIPSLRVKKNGGKTLQDTGQLAASITASISGASVVVHSNKPYFPIHQFGGMAGRNHKAKLPARPIVVLQPEDLSDIREEIIDHYSRLFQGH